MFAILEDVTLECKHATSHSLSSATTILTVLKLRVRTHVDPSQVLINHTFMRSMLVDQVEAPVRSFSQYDGLL